MNIKKKKIRSWKDIITVPIEFQSYCLIYDFYNKKYFHAGFVVKKIQREHKIYSIKIISNQAARYMTTCKDSLQEPIKNPYKRFHYFVFFTTDPLIIINRSSTCAGF